MGIFLRLKGGDKIGKAKRGKDSKVMVAVTKRSHPLAISVFSATPFESTLLEQTIKERFNKTKMRRVVSDQAYHSDPLDKQLRRKDIEIISLHKRNQRKQRTQDRRPLRHCKHRWSVERFFA
ncbi:transposase [Pseudocnuella soli]|uniref:transposase n=1 Tax=Pseudocnuella soli TaxID=2502779 RepID=UPI00104A5E71|nr:transposase [Pseudocnuella soli]